MKHSPLPTECEKSIHETLSLGQPNYRIGDFQFKNYSSLIFLWHEIHKTQSGKTATPGQLTRLEPQKLRFVKPWGGLLSLEPE